MRIEQGDLSSPDVIALLQQHLQDMHATSPPESIHALNLEQLKQPEITFWIIRNEQTVLACGALKKLNSKQCEIKSMRTANEFRSQGIGTKMLNHLIGEAIFGRYDQIFLETGSQPCFEPARRLYKNHGFEECTPFADYVDDPNSVFMMLKI